MGFDLHGMNPQGSTPEPRWTKGDPMVKTGEHSYTIDPQIKEEYDDYMKSKWAWQESTEGAYFRNNVWWWRPLWEFISGICSDILTKEDIRMGGFNDGHKIGKTKARRIAARIRRCLKDEYADVYDSWYAMKQKNLPDDDWSKNYPFNVDNVIAFERFCEHSGGFKIC